MPRNWEECNDEVAAGAICPAPDCGALVAAYGPLQGAARDDVELWEFTCPRCGLDFTVREGELIFQSIPRNWLLAEVHAA